MGSVSSASRRSQTSLVGFGFLRHYNRIRYGTSKGNIPGVSVISIYTTQGRPCSSRHYDTKMPRDDEDEGGHPSSESLSVVFLVYTERVQPVVSDIDGLRSA
jgi:hypothetical protein